jgi:hypothetical protein
MAHVLNSMWAIFLSKKPREAFVSNRFLLLSVGVIFMTGCASGTFKARQEQREKMASSSGMYCEFVSGDLFPDLDVELNMRMAKRCDADRNYSITQYKDSSDQFGIMYCCSMTGSVKPTRSARHEAPVQRSEGKVFLVETPATTPAQAPAVKAPAPAPKAAPAPSNTAAQPQPSQKDIEEAIIGE